MPIWRRCGSVVRGDLVTAAFGPPGGSFVPPNLPALVVGRVSHARHTPLRHAFTHRHYQWLVDLDDLPHLAWPLRVSATSTP